MITGKVAVIFLFICNFACLFAEHRGVISLDSITFDKVISPAEKGLLL